MAGEDHPLGLPRVVFHWLGVLDGLASLRGCLLHIWPAIVLSQEGSCVSVLESSWCADAIVMVPSLLGVVAALDGELVQPVAAEVSSEHNEA